MLGLSATSGHGATRDCHDDGHFSLRGSCRCVVIANAAIPDGLHVMSVSLRGVLSPRLLCLLKGLLRGALRGSQGLVSVHYD